MLIDISKRVRDILTPLIAEIFVHYRSGLLPVVVSNPVGDNIDMLKTFKGAEGHPVFGVPKSEVAEVFALPAEARWLNAEPTPDGPVQVWLIIDAGNLCLEVVKDKGIRIAPGTMDDELMLN